MSGTSAIDDGSSSAMADGSSSSSFLTVIRRTPLYVAFLNVP
jgi:hypothetical protein